MSNFSLYRPADQRWSEFYNSEKWDLNGTVYEDLYEVQPVEGGAYTFLAGAFIKWDKSADAITGGTVNAIAEEQEGGALRFAIQGLSLSAKAVYNAMQTESRSDETSLLKSALGGADTFVLSKAADRARGYDGNDRMNGGGGNDRLYGDSNSDRLFGGGGGDQLYGGSYRDILSGGSGSDRLHAGTGSDVLNGGTGTDRLYGGTDSRGDDFVYRSHLESRVGAGDVIYNFTRASDDIDLRRIDARAGSGEPNDTFGWAGRTATKYKVWWSVEDGDAVLKGDVTGDRRADFEIHLDGLSRIGVDDVLL